MIKIDISIENLKNGWFEYSTIYKGYLIRKLYDTKKKENKNDFLNFVEFHKYLN